MNKYRWARKLDQDASTDEYHPASFTSEFVDTVLEELKLQMEAKYRRVDRMIDIDVDDVDWTNTRIHARITLYINGELKSESCFNFAAYPDYWDESDFEEHINKTIAKFVES